MVRTRRSSCIGKPSPIVSKRHCPHHDVEDGPSTGYNGGRSLTRESYKVLSKVILEATEGVWYRILPVSEFDCATDDIQKATGVDWEYLLPLLLTCGLLYSVVTSDVKHIRVKLAQWQELQLDLQNKKPFEVTCVRRTGGGEEYFFCVGRPFYRSPLVQEDEDRTWRYARTNLRNTELVQEFAEEILNHRRYKRVMEDERKTRKKAEANERNQSIESEIAQQVEESICFALALDLDRRPRLSRTDARAIRILTSRQASREARYNVVHTATLWGWNDYFLTVKNRTRIAKAACNQVAYDLGYPKCLAYTQIAAWYASLNDMVSTGESVDPLSPSNAGSKKYTDELDKEHPGYLHELFRYAQVVKGSLSTFTELAETMNQKSGTPGENRPTICLSRKQLSIWFYQQGGKESSPVEKPLLTDEHKKNRVAWARKYFNLIVDPLKPVAFLDEKWFYTTNRRRKLKLLPKGHNEIEIPKYQRPKIRSRRYPVKVMYMGVVACPNREQNFDGRVFMKRVSERKKVTKGSRNNRFSIDIHINDELNQGRWRTILSNIVEDNEDVTVRYSLDLLIDMYDLDDFVAKRLQFYYVTHTGAQKKNKKFVDLNDDQDLNELGRFTDSDGTQKDLTLEDIQLCVKLEKGDEVDEDVSCDSTFMLKWIPEVAKAMREVYHWIPVTEKLYLVMDNAGGHGTDNAKELYVEELSKHNIETIWQVPRSPETNMLDLGVWMSIQAAVMRVHHNRRCHHDALAKSVDDAWDNYLNEGAFENVHGRLKLVLQSIVKDEGGNRLVEEHRGKLFRDATIVDLTSVDDDENIIINIDMDDQVTGDDDLIDNESDMDE